MIAKECQTFWKKKEGGYTCSTSKVPCPVKEKKHQKTRKRIGLTSRPFPSQGKREKEGPEFNAQFGGEAGNLGQVIIFGREGRESVKDLPHRTGREKIRPA